MLILGTFILYSSAVSRNFNKNRQYEIFRILDFVSDIKSFAVVHFPFAPKSGKVAMVEVSGF